MNLFTFNEGDLIVSAQINANFQEFVKVLGPNSSAGELALPGRMTFGPTRRGSFSALSDRVTSGSKYMHIGWNAEEFINNNQVGIQRRVEQSPSSALRIGDNGFEFLYARGDQRVESMSQVFALTNSGRAVLHPNWSFTTRRSPNEISHYRLTYNPLSTSVDIRNNSSVVANTTVSVDLSDSAINLNSTKNFHAVELVVTAQATSAGSQVSVYGQDMDPYTGLILNLGQNQRGLERGCVVFKRGSSSNSVVLIKNTGALSSLNVKVIGLWK